MKVSSLFWYSLAHWLDWLGWSWQIAPDPLPEQYWLVLVSDTKMHHRAVPISANTCRQALQSFAPTHLTRLIALRHHPAIEMCQSALSIAVRLEIHESMA